MTVKPLESIVYSSLRVSLSRWIKPGLKFLPTLFVFENFTFLKNKINWPQPGLSSRTWVLRQAHYLKTTGSDICTIYLSIYLRIYNSIVKNAVTYGAETWKFNKNLEQKVCWWKWIFEEIGEMFKIEQIRNNVIRWTNSIRNSVLDNIRYKQLSWNGQWMKKDYLDKLWKSVLLEEEEEEEEEEEREDLEIRRCRK